MKRLLYLSYCQPFAPFSGYAYRTVGILQWLTERYLVDVIYEDSERELKHSFIDPNNFNRIIQVAPDSRLLTKFKGVIGGLPYHHTLHNSPEMSRTLIELLSENQYDLIWLNKSVHYPILEKIHSVPPVIIDQHAAEPMVWENLIRSDPRWYVRWYSRLNKRKVMNYERKVYSQIAGTIAISSADAKVMLSYFPDIRQIVVPQGVDTDYYTPNLSLIPDPDLLLFSGTEARRNVQAMQRLITEIMPLVHRERPNMRVLWIGNVKKSRYSFLKQPWIETTGFVEHVPPYFNRGSIYVSPFHMGEGMKTKIVEAMAMGKAIVATPIGLSGIDRAEKHSFIQVGNTNEELASAILSLRASSNLTQLGIQARQHVFEQYSWKYVLAPLQQFLDNIVLRKSS